MIGSTFGPMSRGNSEDEMFGKLYDYNVVKRLFPYIIRYKKESIIGSICTLVSAALVVLIPYFIKVGIDDYIINKSLTNSEKLSIFFAPLGVVSNEKSLSILVMNLFCKSSELIEVVLFTFMLLSLIQR